jgi:hypothetical protein
MAQSPNFAPSYKVTTLKWTAWIDNKWKNCKPQVIPFNHELPIDIDTHLQFL